MSENSCISVSAEHNFYVWNLSNPKQLFTRQKLLLGFNDEVYLLLLYLSQSEL
jgi:hypothetical protein